MQKEVQLAEVLRVGYAHHQAGRMAEAEQAYREALAVTPDSTDGRYLLSAVLLQQERHAEALPFLLALVEAAPAQFDIRFNLGSCYYATRQWSAAAECWRKAGELAPHRWEVPYRLAMCAAIVGSDREVAMLMEQSLQLNPRAPGARSMICNSLVQQGRFTASAMQALHWAKLAGDKNVARYELAQALSKGKLFAAAEQLLVEGVPKSEYEWFLEGHARHYQARLDEACASYKKAIELNPVTVGAHVNYSMALLGNGQMEEGWREFDWRMHPGGPVYGVVVDKPEWDGRELDGEGILVHSEQGFGDVIQFMRFFPQVQARGGRLIFTSYNEVLQLLKSQAGAEVRTDVENFDLSYQWQIPLLSLGKLFANDLDAIPGEPYVAADPVLSAQWRERLSAVAGLKVGLVWSGNPGHINDHNRSALLQDFAPLAALPGVTFYALQKGPTSAQADTPPAGMTVVKLDEELKTFSDTAAVLEQLDLVICVDTSIAHLAGAMGKPVWVLLPQFCDWRWVIGRDDTPWYPTMRLFRSGSIGGWAPVVQRIVPELEKLLQARTDIPAVLWQAKRSEDAGDGAGALAVLRSASDLTAAEQQLVDNYGRGLLLRQPLTLDDACALRLPAASSSPIGDVVLPVLRAAEVLWRAKQVDALSELVETAQARYPESYALQYWQGQVYRYREDWQKAEACYLKALEASPRWPEALINLGLSLWKQQRNPDALLRFERAAICNPGSDRAWFYLGWFLHEVQALELAEFVFEHAVTVFPQVADIRLWRGNVRQRLGKFASALQDVQVAQQMDPALPDIRFRLASATADAGDWEAGERMLRALLADEPGNASADLKLGLRCLQNGHWQEGWARWEARRVLPNIDVLQLRAPGTLPLWDGSALAGRRLLVVAEQGYGDTLQFLRFLPRIAGRHSLVVQPGLGSLLATAGFAGEVHEFDALPELVGTHDCYVNMMSLPLLLGQYGGIVADEEPYLRPALQDHPLRDRLHDLEGLKVGLIWAGNPGHVHTHFRDCPLHALAPMIRRLPQVQWLSLQKDEASNQALFADGMAEQLINAAPELESWLDTAAIVAQLDVLITVDTAAAHLAAAMGKPVWLMLSTEVDWRWGESGIDTAWYRSMRLFRQPALGDWAAVSAQLEAALLQMLAPHA